MDEIELPPPPEPQHKHEENNGYTWYSFSGEQLEDYARAAVLAERERCARLCEARMEEAERESGPEAAGHLEFVADAIRRG